MKAPDLAPLIVEWSPSQVIAFEPTSKRAQRGETIAQAISGFSTSRDVLATVSRRSAFVKTARIPNVEPDETRLILDTLVAGLFPIPPAEVSYDFRLSGDLNTEGRLTLVGAVRSSDLRSLHEQAKAAGVQASRVVPAALGSVLLAENLGHLDCAVAQQTEDGLAIDLIAGGELRYSRVCAMPVSHAGIEAEVARTFAAAGLPCSPTLAAGGLPFAEADLHAKTSSMEAFALPSARNLRFNVETTETIRARVKAQRSQRLRVSLLVLTVSVLLGVAVLMERDAETRKVQSFVDYWNGVVNRKRVIRKHEESRVAANQGYADVVSRAFTPGQYFSDVVTLISNTAPPTVWLTGITLERGKPLIMRGISTNSNAVADYVAKLSAEPRLRDVKLVVANNATIDKTPVVQFSVSAFPVGNLPLLDATTKGAPKR